MENNIDINKLVRDIYRKSKRSHNISPPQLERKRSLEWHKGHHLHANNLDDLLTSMNFQYFILDELGQITDKTDCDMDIKRDIANKCIEAMLGTEINKLKTKLSVNNVSYSVTCLREPSKTAHCYHIYYKALCQNNEIKAIKHCFSLSASEAEIARLYALGHTPKQIAKQTTYTISTVRTYIKSIFAKTGVKRQSQLASAIKSKVLL